MSYTNHLYHVVFATKDRFPFIRQEFRPVFFQYIGGIVRGLGGIALEIGGVDNHVHLLIKLKPTIHFSDFLRDLKSNSSKWARQNGMPKFRWQRRYGSFTVSESQVAKVRAYIKNQEQHHKKFTFEAEFEMFLLNNGIHVDDFVWQD